MWYVTDFDPPVESASGQVVGVLATVSESGPTELPVLADTIDPDALDTLYTSARTTDHDLTVCFRYADHVVCPRSDGSIACRPAGGSDFE
ncbi:hypothetical protein SAMN05216218_10855 [Halorientalis regularis]|uniref:Halobacterial output domain-containing protein n=1 Tax=Halorientalis regularis TaxID=660518 RepID=A0A1G7MSX8_9EURY|nr:hypothetical protein SAMN05216218_10855 [Halorientalis regularis]